MIEFFLEILTFTIKAIVVGGIIIIALGLLYQMIRQEGAELGELRVWRLNDHYEELDRTLQEALLEPKEFRQAMKERKERLGDRSQRPRIFVIDFEGDGSASAVSQLREQVSVVEKVATQQDEVVIRLESPGGMVSEYGLAASQLERLRQANIPLTACVDKVATSGGYMMAVVAHKIVAAPFAMIGSIGVLVESPNFHNFLKQHHVDYLQLTAGEYKTTLSMLGEVTDKAYAKTREEIEETHRLFKAFVTRFRPEIEIETIATGEAWYGEDALQRKLVDELVTSDAYLQARLKDAEIYRIDYRVPHGMRERLSGVLTQGAEQTLTRLWQRLEKSRRPKARG